MHGIESAIAANWPLQQWRDVEIVVAVSGGADSVALLRALLRLGGEPQRLIAAHYNHCWRGEESEADQAFVRELCASLAIRCHVARADGVPESGGDGLEAAARDARYAFLLAVARQSGARYVAVAHTADDQVETVLHRLVRGTGIAGLAGIPRVRPLEEGVTLIRPLLDVRREEVLDYLASLAQPFRCDASNLDTRFTRARIRRELLPHLREAYNPQVDRALLRLARFAGEVQSVIDVRVESLADSVVHADSRELRIDCAGLAAVSPYLLREFCIWIWRSRGWPQQAMSFDRWDELAALMRQQIPNPGKRDFPGGITALRIDRWLTLTVENE
jgi:tRNA(Ile)-lysidine synthase